MIWAISHSLPGLLKSLRAERIDINRVFRLLRGSAGKAGRIEQAVASRYDLSTHLLASQLNLRV